MAAKLGDPDRIAGLRFLPLATRDGEGTRTWGGASVRLFRRGRARDADHGTFVGSRTI